MEKKSVKPPTIPIRPGPNQIIVERITIESKLERSQKEKAPNLQLTRDQIAKMNKEKLESTNDILSVWDAHPLQAVIVAINDKTAEDTGYLVGDRIAFRIDENVGLIMVFKKKKYMCLYPHDILFKYLTKEA